MAIIARRITARPISARRVNGRGQSIDNAVTDPWLFDFSGKMTALPLALQKMNATYTRNSDKRVVQDGALVTLAANQFGTSYDPVTGLYGYMPEPAATNLATNSDGAASTYTVSNVADGTAVPGFTNGLAFGNNSVERSVTKSISVTSGTAYSISFFVIMDDGNAPVVGTANNTGDFSITLNGVIATTKLERLIGAGVYRVSASITASATASHAAGVTKYVGKSARTFRITGAQVETGLRATSYIATAGSTASRAADVLRVPLANIPGFSAAGYTLFADGRADTAFTGVNVLCTVSDGTSNNYARVGQNLTSKAVGIIVSGGVSQAAPAISGRSVSRVKLSMASSDNSILLASDGAAGTPDTSATMPVSPTQLNIGGDHAGLGPFNGFVFRTGLIPQALTQAQLNGLTA